LLIQPALRKLFLPTLRRAVPADVMQASAIPLCALVFPEGLWYWPDPSASGGIGPFGHHACAPAAFAEAQTIGEARKDAD
jgi:hypothetical protein